MSVEGSDPTIRAFMLSLLEKLTLTDRETEKGNDRLCAHNLRGRHLHDARSAPPVDVVNGERLAGLEGGRAGRACGRLNLADRGRRRRRKIAEQGRAPERERGSEAGGGRNPGADEDAHPCCHE